MPPTDSLFFAVFPDAATAKSIEIFLRELCAEHRVIGKPLAARRFHVSLHHLGNYHGLPADAITLAEQAAAAVALLPFELKFDHVMSFKGRPGNQPLVLGSSGGLPALSTLHKTLYDVLKPTVFEPFVQLRFKPHLTLLYGEQGSRRHLKQLPGWHVNSFWCTACWAECNTSYYRAGRCAVDQGASPTMNTTVYLREKSRSSQSSSNAFS